MTARPKIVDIAREAGVSPATVDRVLNGRAGVSNSTVSRVSDAVKKLDYVRDCLLYTSPSPRDRTRSRMPSSA